MLALLTANIYNPYNLSPPLIMTGERNMRWNGINAAARAALETRSYAVAGLRERLATTGLGAGDVVRGRPELDAVWIPGVEVFPRRVYQQKGRGYFAELARVTDGVLERIGLTPRQWSSALMHRGSAKGFHIHPPYVPDGVPADEWLAGMFGDGVMDVSRRMYEHEQWDVMFFLTGTCEMVLVDERVGLPRRVMRLALAGDNKPGPDNAGVVIPPGVAHALRNIGNDDVIMVYGTSTCFNPEWEGRLVSGVETDVMPAEWQEYLVDHDTARGRPRMAAADQANHAASTMTTESRRVVAQPI